MYKLINVHKKQENYEEPFVKIDNLFIIYIIIKTMLQVPISIWANITKIF